MSASSSELLVSADCSGGSGVNLLLQQRAKKQEVSLKSFASEEDDDVLFDSKQLFFGVRRSVHSDEKDLNLTLKHMARCKQGAHIFICRHFGQKVIQQSSNTFL